MRSRRVAFLSGVLAIALLAGGGAVYVLWRHVQGSPEKVSRDYFDAWRRGALDRMERLAADPPADFAAQHRALSQGLSVTSITLTPGPVVRDTPDAAHVVFGVTRYLAGHGAWTFRSTLLLALMRGRWRVAWSPDTLYPGLRGPGGWRLRQIPAPTATFVARDGTALPEDGPLQPYVVELTAGRPSSSRSSAVTRRRGFAPRSTRACRPRPNARPTAPSARRRS